MREVFGERGNPYDSAARAIKPTEVGDAAKRPNHDKTQVNTARRDISGCPRRGGRCGDRVQGSIPIASRRELSLKKGSSGIKERHHSTSLIQFDECRPRFDARTTGFFAVEDNTSCDFKDDDFLLHYTLLTRYF